jgi:hypothetical protein
MSIRDGQMTRHDIAAGAGGVAASEESDDSPDAIAVSTKRAALGECFRLSGHYGVSSPKILRFGSRAKGLYRVKAVIGPAVLGG